MRHLSTVIALSGLLLAGPLAGLAEAGDADDIRSVISGQLNAFRVHDGGAAYSFAAPNIKAIFPTADSFMTMVETGYSAVFQSSNATFGPMTAEGSGFRQEVYLTDTKGVSYIASYTLARQPDGSLKITGCSIRKGDDLAA